MLRLLGSIIAVAAIASSGCLDCSKGGPFCGAEGTAAPALAPCTKDLDCRAGLACSSGICQSPCQPRGVMPQFFALIDNKDPSFAGLKSAMADLGAARCAAPADLSCKSDN